MATTVSDSEGNYQFLNVRIGTYSVRAELQGFSAAIAENISVTVNARQRVDLTMKVGDIGETVVVTGAARLLESESSDRGQVIGREQIVNLPLNGRAYADLALLSPGVRKSSISDSRDGSFNVNGLRSSLNNFILDGVDNNSYGTSNQGFSNQVVQVTPDAVEEFKVQTNNFSAEFGRAGGAVINATFRSGTNAFRGTAWEFNRNTSLNATGFFKPSSGVKPTLDRNQFGGVFGGPDRQGPRVLLRQLRRVPPGAAHRHLRQHSDDGTAAGHHGEAGAESADRRALRRWDRPASGDHVLRAPGARGSARADPVRRSPTTSTACRGGRTTTTSSTSSSTSRSTVRRAAFVRFSNRDADNFEPPPIPGETSSPSNAYVDILNQQVAGGVTRTLGLSSLLEVRIGVSRTKAGKTALGTGSPNMYEAYGITGLPTDTVFAGGLTQQSVSGWTAWGRQSSNPQFQDPLVIDARVNYTWMRGRHYAQDRLRVSAHQYRYRRRASEVRRRRLQRAVQPADRGGSRRGDLQPRRLPVRRAQHLRARQPVRLRAPSADALRLPAGRLARVTPNLTFNLGLRYELGTPQWEDNNYLTNFDPATNTLLQASDGSLYDRIARQSRHGTTLHPASASPTA